MKKYNFRHNKCYLHGDTHSTELAYDAILHKIPEGSDYLHLGDLGIGFGSDIYAVRIALSTLDRINKLCHKRNIVGYFLRGNHDATYDEIWSSEWSNIHLIKDSDYVIFPNGKKALLVSGGISIDRCQRSNNFDYWVGEPTPILKNLEKCDMMFSHDCPEHFNHSTSSLYQRFQWAMDKDPLLVEDCNIQRINMSNIAKDSGVDTIFYGHFHNNTVEYIDEVYARCININEVFEFDSDKKYKL